MTTVCDPDTFCPTGCVGSLIFRAFEPSDLDAIVLQPRQAMKLGQLREPAIAAAIAGSGMAYTVRQNMSEPWHLRPVLAIVGLHPLWAHRGHAWALIGAAMPRTAWPAFSRHCGRLMDWYAAQGWFRIDALCDVDFPAAHRWVRLLGFTDLRIEEYASAEGDALTCKRLRLPQEGGA